MSSENHEIWNIGSEYHSESLDKHRIPSMATSNVLVNEAFDLMIGGWLEHGYCSIIISNHRLIRLIRFGSQICTYLWKSFVNRLHLVLQNSKIPTQIDFI